MHEFYIRNHRYELALLFYQVKLETLLLIMQSILQVWQGLRRQLENLYYLSAAISFIAAAHKSYSLKTFLENSFLLLQGI
jgi:hypothetical protein